MADVSATLRELFAAEPAAVSSPQLNWFLLNRRGRPFLLLPRSYCGVSAGMELYPAQRPLAKLVRQCLPLAIQLSLGRLLPTVQVETNFGNALWRFLSEAAGVAPERLPLPAMLWGNQPVDRQRFVILVLNAQAQPVAVVKCGLTAEARRIIEQEAAVLATLPTGLPGVLALQRKLVTPVLSAFATPYCPGHHPRNAEQMAEILTAWLRPGGDIALEDLPTWRGFAATCSGNKLFQALHQLLAQQSVRPAIHHGDFAPWNIRVNGAGQWTAVDWERGELQGIPGWDWFHYVIQTAVLVERLANEALVTHIEATLDSASFKNYAATAKIGAICRPLLLAYLLHQNEIVKPGEGREVSLNLQARLASRWQIGG
jgi:hypothetical protein